MAKNYDSLYVRWNSVTKVTMKKDIDPKYRKGIAAIPEVFFTFGMRKEYDAKGNITDDSAMLITVDDSGKELAKPRTLNDGEFNFCLQVLRKKWKADQIPMVTMHELQVVLGGKSETTLRKYLRIFENNDLCTVTRKNVSYGGKNDVQWYIDFSKMLDKLVILFELWLSKQPITPQEGRPDPELDLEFTCEKATPEEIQRTLKQLSAEFDAIYGKEYGQDAHVSKYPTVKKEDAVERTLDEANLVMRDDFTPEAAVEVVTAAYQRYVNTKDDYLVRERHALAIFAKQSYYWISAVWTERKKARGKPKDPIVEQPEVKKPEMSPYWVQFQTLSEAEKAPILEKAISRLNPFVMSLYKKQGLENLAVRAALEQNIIEEMQVTE